MQNEQAQQKSSTKSLAQSNGKWTTKDVYNGVAEVGSTVVARVRERPVEAAIGGLFLGFLLGAMLSGRKGH